MKMDMRVDVSGDQLVDESVDFGYFEKMIGGKARGLSRSI